MCARVLLRQLTGYLGSLFSRSSNIHRSSFRHPSMHSSMHSSIHASIHASIRAPIHAPIHPPTHLFNHQQTDNSPIHSGVNRRLFQRLFRGGAKKNRSSSINRDPSHAWPLMHDAASGRYRISNNLEPCELSIVQPICVASVDGWVGRWMDGWVDERADGEIVGRCLRTGCSSVHGWKMRRAEVES